MSILQLKVSLDGIKPSIWRRFLVKDNISFEDLHCVIQDIMGWEDYHLYEFNVNNERISPDAEDTHSFNPAESVMKDLFGSNDFKKMLESAISNSKGKKEGISLDIDKVNQLMTIQRREKGKETQSLVEMQVSNLIFC